MTDAYLRRHKPARSQYRSPRRLDRSPLPGRCTGLVVLHTAESILDTVGPDTGAENVARYMVTRTTPGSYHDLADADSNLTLVRYADEAYQDGTGSNPYALSISFALKAADWPRLSPARRAAFLEQGAAAFARQQAWLDAHRYPRTLLRRVTRAQSAAGASGFVTHGDRDPGRRSDPGAAFPWDEWLAACLTAVTPAKPAPTPAPPTEKDDPMARLIKSADSPAVFGTDGVGRKWHVPSTGVLGDLRKSGIYGDGAITIVSDDTLNALATVGDT